MVDQMQNFELSPPLDLSHHFSDTTKHRAPSAIKAFYKYFSIPGIGNLAGGLFVYVVVRILAYSIAQVFPTLAIFLLTP